MILSIPLILPFFEISATANSKGFSKENNLSLLKDKIRVNLWKKLQMWIETNTALNPIFLKNHDP